MTYNHREDGEFGEGATMTSTIKEHLIAERDVHSEMLKWQRRAEDRHNRGPWMGVSLIAGNLRVSKPDARSVINPLIAVGLVEQFQFSNGVFYRAIAAQETSHAG